MTLRVSSVVFEDQEPYEKGFCKLSSKHYTIGFNNDIVVEVRRAGPVWETWCCDLGETHVDEGAALDWAFELSYGAAR